MIDLRNITMSLVYSIDQSPVTSLYLMCLLSKYRSLGFALFLYQQKKNWCSLENTIIIILFFQRENEFH